MVTRNANNFILFFITLYPSYTVFGVDITDAREQMVLFDVSTRRLRGMDIACAAIAPG